MALLALYRSRPGAEECRSISLRQGDPSELKERDIKPWTDDHDVETFTKEIPDGKTFWEDLHGGVVEGQPRCGVGAERCDQRLQV